MGFATFTKDARVVLDNRRCRLVRKNNDGEWLLEDLDDGNVILRPERALHNMYCQYKMTFILGSGYESPKPVITRTILGPKDKALIGLRLAFVKAVQNLPITEDIWTETITATWKEIKRAKTQVYMGLDDPEMKRAYKRAWNKLLRSEKRFGWITVYRWAQRYHDHGDDEVALLDKNRGTRDRQDIYGSVVLGLCELAIDERYMIREPASAKSVWETAKRWVAEEQDKLDREFTEILKIQQTHGPFATPPKQIELKIPTFRLIRRLIDERPAFDRYAAKHGMDAAIRHFRFVVGRDLPAEPLQEAQLDHTVLDLFVVDDEHWLPLGRPCVTACLDSRTRCVLGIYIGFIRPSGLSVSLCLKDAFMPKYDYDTLYPEIENEMPFGIPRSIKWDNGLEEHSQQAIYGCGRVGIREIVFCPRKKAWYKAEVERFFRTLNEFLHTVPGTSFSNIVEKGDYNPEKFAVVRLSTLRLGIRKWIADVYHQTEHRVLKAKPMDVWRKEIRADLRRVPHDPRLLDAIMGRPHKKRLTHDGIHIHNLRYAGSALQELRVQHGANLDVDITVNEDNLGTIFVLWQDQIIEAKAVDFSYADGLTLWQHEKIQEHQRMHDLPDGSQGWLLAKEEIRQLFEYDFTGKCRPKGYARHFDRGEHASSQQPKGPQMADQPSNQPSNEHDDMDLYTEPIPAQSELSSYLLPEEPTS